MRYRWLISRPDEDAAICLLIELELEVEYEIAILCLRPDIIAALINREHAVFHFPAVRFRDAVGEIRKQQVGPSTLLQGSCFFIEELDTFADLGNRIFPIVLIFDREHPAEFLLVQLFQDRFHVADAGSPRNIVRLHVAKFVQVLEMQADDMSLEHLDAVDRLDAAACPVTDIGTGADPGCAVPGHLQHKVGTPVMRRLGMIVDGHLDVVFLAEALDHVEGIFRRLRDDRLNSHVFRKLENLPALLLVIGELGHAEVHQLHSSFGKQVLDKRALLGWHERVHLPIGMVLFHGIDNGYCGGKMTTGNKYFYDIHI